MNIISLGNSLSGLIGAAGRNSFAMQYEISPILLKNGIAEQMQDKVMPIMQLTQGGSFPVNLSAYFAHWKPMPGSTILQNTIGQYPFANQSVAANAIISQPLNVSMMMTCPANSTTGMGAKTSIFNSLQQAISNHIALGGMFVVITPSYVYDNCVLMGIRDISGGESKQPQYQWAWDFTRPQIMTTEEATGAQNSLMAKLSSGTKVTNTAWSGSH